MEIICLALRVYYVILVIRIILSFATMAWSPPRQLTPAIRIVYDLTEPVLGLFRRYIPPIGALDISPLFIFLILSALTSQLCS